METRCLSCDETLSSARRKYCGNRCKLAWHRKNNPAYAETRKQCDARWYTENRDHDLARKAAYEKRTPGYSALKAARRKTRKRSGEGNYTTQEAAALLEAQGEKCFYCQEQLEVGRNRTLDHILSLSRGGSNSIANQVYACRRCNSSKSGKTLAEWLVWKGRAGQVLVHPLTGEILHTGG